MDYGKEMLRSQKRRKVVGYQMEEFGITTIKKAKW